MYKTSAVLSSTRSRSYLRSVVTLVTVKKTLSQLILLWHNWFYYILSYMILVNCLVFTIKASSS